VVKEDFSWIFRKDLKAAPDKDLVVANAVTDHTREISGSVEQPTVTYCW
jgi:hypothetical protein